MVFGQVISHFSSRSSHHVLSRAALTSRWILRTGVEAAEFKISRAIASSLRGSCKQNRASRFSWVRLRRTETSRACCRMSPRAVNSSTANTQSGLTRESTNQVNSPGIVVSQSLAKRRSLGRLTTTPRVRRAGDLAKSCWTTSLRSMRFGTDSDRSLDGSTFDPDWRSISTSFLGVSLRRLPPSGLGVWFGIQSLLRVSGRTRDV